MNGTGSHEIKDALRGFIESSIPAERARTLPILAA